MACRSCCTFLKKSDVVAVQSLKSLVKREDDRPRRPALQSRVDDRLKIAGKRVPDMVVHLACFGIAMLARNVLRPHYKTRR